MFFKTNPVSGVPVYIQLMEQVKHAVETGALKPGEQLPAIRKVAEDLVINPNTIAKVYRELEHDGIIELRQGAGAFVAEGVVSRAHASTLSKARPLIMQLVSRLRSAKLTEEEIRRLVEAELTRLRE